MQKAARDAVERGLQELDAREGYTSGRVQGALLCMEGQNRRYPGDGRGPRFGKSEFNRATQSRRQPGSAFKPFIYTAAFDKGMTPVTKFVDAPIVYQDSAGNVWNPQNFDGKFLGPTTLRYALAHSRNIITIKVLQDLGWTTPSPMPTIWGSALPSAETSPSPSGPPW